MVKRCIKFCPIQESKIQEGNGFLMEFYKCLFGDIILSFQHEKRHGWGFLVSFTSFKKKGFTNVHNKFSLMLEPRFKMVCFVSSLMVHEQRKAQVGKYDNKPLFPTFIKCHSH
jgi:hypothetical protein